MAAEIGVILLLLLLLLILIIYAAGKKKSHGDFQKSIPRTDTEGTGNNLLGSKCPLCGEFLERGQRVHSHLFPGKPDGLMHIFGCPYCYEGHPARETADGRIANRRIANRRIANRRIANRRIANRRIANRRICPFCHEALGADDYVIARVFEKPGKTQVHVLGCTICREKR